MNNISGINCESLFGLQNKQNKLQKFAKPDNDESIFSQTKSQDYQNDTKQLQEDRNYFNGLYRKLQQGDKEAFEELKSIQVGEYADGNDYNAKLYNQNTALLQQMKTQYGDNSIFTEEEIKTFTNSFNYTI